jgi:tetratricopeptide (TPR) repeat protein
LTGYIAVGTTCTWTGEYRAAATSLDQGVAICERLLLGLPEPMLRFVKEPLFYGRGWLTTTLWTLGYAEQALRQIDRMQAVPEWLLSSYDTAVAINIDLLTRLYLLRDHRGGREKAEALTALARENGFSFHELSGLGYLGVVAVQEGAIDEGIRAMLQVRDAFRGAGEMLMFQWIAWRLADAYLTARRPAEGLAAVDEAIAGADQLQIGYYEAEVHRLKGELLLVAGAPEPDAEASMRRAIAIAQHQEAKGWELRAATSLARLLRKQGRIAEARDALAPVYNWFTEGLDTADLKDAKALLDELDN